MNELSTIIEEYTDRSFLILDEIGRGTSTYDGLAIAWAALDYLCAEGRRARCMFATHYHELTVLEGRLAGLKNLHTEVDDSGSGIVYLHKIAAGASSRSYGIHVAEMAGLPADILRDAEEKLAALESEAKEIRIVAPETGTGQISMFAEFAVAQPTRGGCSEVGRMRNGGKHAGADRAGDASGACADLDGELARALKDVDVFELTPSAAIALVEKLKKMAAGCP
jgi:DNA mismatch repair ATPase MutS